MLAASDFKKAYSVEATPAILCLYQTQTASVAFLDYFTDAVITDAALLRDSSSEGDT